LGFGELLVEAVDTAVVSNVALFARIERVAIRAGINLDFVKGGTSFERGAAAHAGHGAFVIRRVDVLFHVHYSFRRTVNAAQRVRLIQYTEPLRVTSKNN
jgi:hypothetical protein